MSLIDTFSPPLEVTLVTGDVVHFKRMLMDDWAAFCQQLDAERYAEAVKIVNADKKLEPAERVIALRRAKDERCDLYEVMARTVRTVEGIQKLLKFSLVAKDKTDLLAIIEPPVVAVIVDEIIHRPILPKETVRPLESSGGTSEASATSETGSSTPVSSADTSTSNQEASPSATSST